jgi:hypothetical protein
VVRSSAVANGAETAAFVTLSTSVPPGMDGGSAQSAPPLSSGSVSSHRPQPANSAATTIAAQRMSHRFTGRPL